MYIFGIWLAYISIVHAVSSYIQVPLSNEPPPPPPTKKRLSFKDVLSGSLHPESTSLQWASSGEDGSYIEVNQTTQDLWLAHVLHEKRELLVNATDLTGVLQEHNLGEHVSISGYTIQPGGRKVLVTTNYTKLYRHSGFADYFVYNPETGDLKNLDDRQPGKIRYAGWSPSGDSIAYVQGNNLYVYRDGRSTQITHDGSADVFNGVPDWTYEEEIFSSTNTLWFSPDSRYLAFLRFDETDVPTYRVPYYMTGQKATAYPRELELKYPKAGQPIPTVTLHLVHLYDLDQDATKIDFDAFQSEDLLIGEVAWITDAHSHLAWKCFNRVQDHEKLVVLDLASKHSFVATDRKEPNGWIDNTQSIRYVPRMNYYVYLSDEDGWTHIYMQYVNATKPLQLTMGEWEVTKILHVSSEAVYYQSTERDSTERHVYSLDLDFLNKVALVNDTEAGYYSTSFSHKGGYYVLSFAGPGLPRQELFSLNDTSNSIKVLQNNNKLAKELSHYELPTTSWTTIKHPDGFDLNVLEMRPPNFDPRKKYPLLLNPYGGPGAQETGKIFSGANWWAYIASDPQLEYVVLTVDGRGTGFKGKAFRSVVTSRLGRFLISNLDYADAGQGHYEALDQAFAAEFWSNKSYIDSNKIVVQGWSYGGYLSAKCIELNSNIFSSAIVSRALPQS